MYGNTVDHRKDRSEQTFKKKILGLIPVTEGFPAAEDWTGSYIVWVEKE